MKVKISKLQKIIDEILDSKFTGDELESIIDICFEEIDKRETEEWKEE